MKAHVPMGERVVGSVVGLAVGDALGYPHEFRRVEQVRREIGPDGITDFIALKDPRFSRPIIVGTDHPPGTFTDDTQMTICIAEALCEAGASVTHDVPPHANEPELVVDTLMNAIARRFVAWAAADDNDRSPGGTCLSGCAHLRDGVPWSKAGVVESKGCGANMRVAPIGLYFHDLDVVESVARAQSLLTHAHPAALEASAAAALCVALALHDVSPEAMHAEVQVRCGGRSDDFDEIWARIPAAVSHAPHEVLVERETSSIALGEAWVAEEAIASALYCVWRHRDDFRAGVLEAVNTDGDSDSIACIAGGILGARLGIRAVPTTWATRVEQSIALHELARRLYSTSKRVSI